MTPAKRTPYREQSVASTRNAAPRGPIVKRAEAPLDDPMRPSKTEEPRDPDAGIFSGLVSPHPASTPGQAWAQRILTLIALPLIVSTFVSVGWLDTRRAYGEVVKLGHQTPRPLGISHPIAWLFGAAPIGLACFASEVHWLLAAAAIGVPFVALLARRAIRASVVEHAAINERLSRRKQRA